MALSRKEGSGSVVLGYEAGLDTGDAAFLVYPVSLACHLTPPGQAIPLEPTHTGCTTSERVVHHIVRQTLDLLSPRLCLHPLIAISFSPGLCSAAARVCGNESNSLASSR